MLSDVLAEVMAARRQDLVVVRGEIAGLRVAVKELADGRGVDGQELLELVDRGVREAVAEAEAHTRDALRPLVLEAVQAGMAADNAATADEIVDALVERLAPPA